MFCGIPLNQRQLHLRRDRSGTLNCVTLHVIQRLINKIALNSSNFRHVLERSILSKKDSFNSKAISNSLLRHSVPHSTPFYDILQNSPLFQHIPLLHILAGRYRSHPTCTGDLYYVTLQQIPLESTTLPSIPQHSTTLYRVPFCKRMLHSFPKETVY